MYEYAYLVLVLMIGLIWLVFFFKRKDLRKEQLAMSLILAPSALTQVIFYHDYWKPNYVLSFPFFGVPIGIEEFMFCFFMGGIACVIYEFFTNESHRRGRKNNFLAIGAFVLVVCLFFVFSFLGLNSIWAANVACVSGALLVTMLNRHLLPDLLWSSALTASLLFGVYLVWLFFFPEAVDRLWVAEGLSGINIKSVPIEEIAFYLSWGMFGGVLYEYWINIKSYPLLKKVK